MTLLIFKKRNIFLLASLIILAFAGCEYFELMNYNEWLENQDVKPAVYACGTIGSVSPLKGVYWKNNDPPIYLENCTSANSIYVSGQDVYVAGGYSTSPSYPAYWKNGKQISLEHIGSAFAYDIEVCGGTVYVAGRDDGKAVLWINGREYQLNNGGNDYSYAYSLYITDNGGIVDILIGGAYTTGTTYPCYWTDNGREFHPLSSSAQGQVNSIFHYGGTIFNGGYMSPNGTLWENDVVKYTISGSQIKNISVKNGAIYYTAGLNYYINSTMYTPNNAAAVLSGITVFNGNVYVNSVVSSRAVYWINTDGPYYFESNGETSNIGINSSIFVTWDTIKH